MKVIELVKRLRKLNQDLDVVVDLDEHGFYNLEKVKVCVLEQYDEDEDELVVNIISSNEC